MSTILQSIVQSPYNYTLSLASQGTTSEIVFPCSPGEHIEIIDKTLASHSLDLLAAIDSKAKTMVDQLGVQDTQDTPVSGGVRAHTLGLPLAWTPKLPTGIFKPTLMSTEETQLHGFDRFSADSIAGLLGIRETLRVLFESHGQASCPSCGSQLSNFSLKDVLSNLEEGSSTLLFVADLNEEYFRNVPITLQEYLSIFEILRLIVKQKLISRDEFCESHAKIAATPIQNLHGSLSQIQLGLWSCSERDLNNPEYFHDVNERLQRYLERGISGIGLLQFKGRHATPKSLGILREEFYCEACKTAYSLEPHQGTQLLAESAISIQGVSLQKLARMNISEFHDWLEKFASKDEQLTLPINEETLSYIELLGLSELSITQPYSELNWGTLLKMQLFAFLQSKVEGCLIMLGAEFQLLSQREYLRCIDCLRQYLAGNALLSLRIEGFSPQANEVYLLEDREGGAILTKPQEFKGRPGSLKLKTDFKGDVVTLGDEGKSITISLGEITVIRDSSESGTRSFMQRIWKDSKRLLQSEGNKNFSKVRYLKTTDQAFSSQKTFGELSGLYSEFIELLSQTAQARKMGITREDFSLRRSKYRCEQCERDENCSYCFGTGFQSELLDLSMESVSLASFFQSSPEQLMQTLGRGEPFSSYLELLLHFGLGGVRINDKSTSLGASELWRLWLFRFFRDLGFGCKILTKELGELWLLEYPDCKLSLQFKEVMCEELRSYTKKGVSILCFTESEYMASRADLVCSCEF